MSNTESELASAHKEGAAALGQISLMLASRRLRPRALRDLAASLRRAAQQIETVADRLAPAAPRQGELL